MSSVPCSASREAVMGGHGGHTVHIGQGQPKAELSEDGTVLAQFSSVVADTQQYIMPGVCCDPLKSFVLLCNINYL